jgi:hypothetical protein
MDAVLDMAAADKADVEDATEVTCTASASTSWR